MGQGLRLFNENGQIYFDTDMQPCRTLGVLYTNGWGARGSIHVPEFSQGTPWITATVNYDDMFWDNPEKSIESKIYVIPKIEGEYINWEWGREDRHRYNYASWIIYGIFYE